MAHQNTALATKCNHKNLLTTIQSQHLLYTSCLLTESSFLHYHSRAFVSFIFVHQIKILISMNAASIAVLHARVVATHFTMSFCKAELVFVHIFS